MHVALGVFFVFVFVAVHIFLCYLDTEKTFCMSKRVAFSLLKRVKTCTLLQNWDCAKSMPSILMGTNRKLTAPSQKNARTSQELKTFNQQLVFVRIVLYMPFHCVQIK